MFLHRTQKVVLATGNNGKVQELQHLLKSVHFKIIPQAELHIPEIEEIGHSFVENALLKARNASQYSDLPAIADDSGLLVDALHDKPGLHSARYAGPHATAEENIEKLLHELKDVPEEKRTAHFHCAIVYMQHSFDPAPIICQGRWEGRILFIPRGPDGFGYDPVFFIPALGRSAAELTIEEKNKLSHRGKALGELLERLK